MNWIWLVIFVSAPAILSVLFLLLKKTGFEKWNYFGKQAVIGAAFGLCVYLSVKTGTAYNGFELSIGIAFPLCAGFAFGGPAGILAGIIGAAARLLGTYPAISNFAEIAVCISLLSSGVFAALSRRFLFEKNKISVTYGSLITVFAAVLQSMLVFLIHVSNVPAAFEYVDSTAILTIVINTTAVLIASSVCFLMTREKTGDADKEEHKKPPIVRTFAVCLMICVILSFLAAGFFTSFLQTNISRIEVENQLSMTVADAVSDIKNSVDRELLSLTKTLAERINNNDTSAVRFENSRQDAEVGPGTMQKLNSFAQSNTLTYACYTGGDGKIIIGIESSLDGYDLLAHEELADFITLSKSKDDPCDSKVEAMVASQFTTIHVEGNEGKEGSDVQFKFAAASLAYRTGFLVAGFGIDRYNESLRAVVAESALHRHIGNNGYLYVLDAGTGELVSCPDDTITAESALQIYNQIDRTAVGQVLSYTDSSGVGYYYWLSETNGYLLIGCMPTSEANFYRDIAVYILCFMLLLVFFLLFTVVFLLLKGLIVNNVHKINNSLTKITEGDLSEQVDVRESREFNKLSDDINKTVGRLKELISEAEKRIDEELGIAKSIQLSVLPSGISPKFNRSDFEIFAHMDPAKEVGGDFYDFYMVGENRLVFMIADVSGKGIPAAMFMMNAKSIIKDLVESGMPVCEAFEKANDKFCESNEAAMFVTAWIGSLDLETGVVTFANAGHNPPVIRRGNGEFAYFKSRPGFVLAGMEGVRYREGEFTLAPGDEILLYTDGVTEATDKNYGLFGESRLLSVLNANRYGHCEELCTAVKQAIDEFVGEAPQFDDITMVSLKYFGK